MDDISVFLEHIDLFDRLDGLDIEFLKRGLQLLVVGAGRLVDFLGLAARCPFASVVFWCLLAGRLAVQGTEGRWEH
jgi:hypothetical protein